jgi:peptide/nickel transport system ATP-binding protein
MYAGRLVEEALGRDLFNAPRHPYTQGLLAALPALTGPRRRLAAIPGTVPEPGKAPAGCAFAPRCPLAEPRCQSDPPATRHVGLLHRTACHLPSDLGFSAWSLPKAAE